MTFRVSDFSLAGENVLNRSSERYVLIILTLIHTRSVMQVVGSTQENAIAKWTEDHPRGRAFHPSSKATSLLLANLLNVVS